MKIWHSALLVLVLAITASATTYYVSPTGTGTGTSANPCSIRSAFAGTCGAMTAGDTVQFRAGTYVGKFSITASGTTGNKVTFINYPGEIPVIDGFQTTTLNGAITNVTTTVTLTSATNVPAGSVIVVDTEHIQLGTPSGATYTGCTRGWNGTTPASHTDGTLAVLGGNMVDIPITTHDVRLQGFTIRNTDPLRVMATTNTQNFYRLRGICIFLNGVNVDIINNVLIEGENGIFKQVSATGSVIAGNFVAYNGYVYANTTFAGHGFYMQNATGTALLRDDVVMLNFSIGMVIESQTGNEIGFRIQRSMSAAPGLLANQDGHFPILVGANNGIADDDQVTDSFTYNPTGSFNASASKFGYSGTNGTGVLTGNFFVGAGQGWEIRDWANLTVTGNTFITQQNATSGNTFAVLFHSTGTPTNSYNNNTYKNTAVAQDVFGNANLVVNQTFAQWKTATGFDAASTYSTAALTGADTFVIPNEYETGRGWVYIYNWGAANTVSVNLSTLGLTNGQGYKIYQMQNYLTGIPVSGTYNSGSPSVSFDMRTSTWGATVDVPTGWTWPFAIPASMLPKFGVFLVTPTTAPTITVSVETTAQQTKLTYNPPDGGVCTWEVSESNTYAPLIDDVNPALFTNSNRDDRAGSLGVGTTSRTFIVGTVPLDGRLYDALGSDGKIHNRSEALNTTHYGRVTCSGGVTGTVSWTTNNVPLGATRAKLPPLLSPGIAGWPTLEYLKGVAQSELIDPTTGLKFEPFIPGRGTISEPVTTKAPFTSTALGTNWVNPNNILVDDGASTTYTGTTQDWLALKLSGINVFSFALYAIKDWIRGSATGTGDNATLQQCFSKDGVNCFSDIQEMALVSTVNMQHCFPYNLGDPTNCSAEPAAANTWKVPPRPITATDVSSCSTCYIMVRKKGTGAGTVTLQYAAWDFLVDYLPAWYDNGAQQAWSRTTVNDSSGTPGYLLMTRQVGLSNVIWWVNSLTGRARFMGDTFIGADANYGRSYINGFTSGFLDTDPTVFMGVANDAGGNTIITKLQFPPPGSYWDTAKAKDSHITATVTNLTLAPNVLKAKMAAFDPTFVPADYGCSFSHVQRGYAFVRCFRGQQDSLAYIAGIDATTGAVGRMIFSETLPGCDWCGYHTEEMSSQDSQFFSFGLADLHGNGTTQFGGGPYTVHLTSALHGIGGAGCGGVVTDGCTDSFTIDSATPTAPIAPTTLHPLRVGNWIRPDENTATDEIMVVTSISGTNIQAIRGNGYTIPQEHVVGASVRAICAVSNTIQTPEIYWDFTGDPTGAAIVKDFGNLSGAHRGMARKSTGTGAWGVSAAGWYSKEVVDESTAPATGIERSITRSPTFGGINDIAHGLDRCAGNACQSHPEPPHNFADSDATARNSALDILPHVGDTGLNCASLTLVSGQLYQCVPSLPLNRKTIPTLVAFPTKMAKDISGPGSLMNATSAGNYTYCVPNLANECWPGSTPGDVVYVNAPQITTASVCSPGGETANTGEFKEDGLCAGPTQSYVDALVQFRLDRADATGINTRALSFGLWTPFRRMSNTATTKISPNGKLVLVPIRPDVSGRDFDMFIGLMPPMPADDLIDRTKLVQKPIVLSGPINTVTAILEFGLTPQFYPTSRNDVGIANNSSGTSLNPYYFASESYSRVACPSGICTINLPVFPGYMMYARPKYYDAGGSLISTGATFVATDAGSMAPVVRTCTWISNPACLP